MARTQKNKATSSHLGMLKAKLAKLRRELITPKGGGGGPGEGRPSFKSYLGYSCSTIHLRYIFTCQFKYC